MNSKKLIIIALVIVAFIAGCDKKKNSGSSGGNPTAKGYMPETITNHYGWDTYNAVLISSYEYDAQNRMKSIKEFYGDNEENAELVGEFQFSYSSSGQLTGYTYTNYIEGEFWQENFRYEGNSIFVWDDEGELILNDKKQVIQMIETYEEEEYSAHFSYDGKGNCIKVETTEILEGTTSTYEIEITYDNKKGITSSINMPSWFLLFGFLDEAFYLHQENNALRINYSYDDSEEFSYIYNSNNYPERVDYSESYDSKKKFERNGHKRTKSKIKRANPADDYYDYYIIKYTPTK